MPHAQHTTVTTATGTGMAGVVRTRVPVKACRGSTSSGSEGDEHESAGRAPEEAKRARVDSDGLECMAAAAAAAVGCAPGTPDEEAEPALFALWVNASEKEARAAVFPVGHALHVAASDASTARDAFLAQYRTHTAAGWAYDAAARRFVAFLDGLDVCTESTFFTHMPLGADAVAAAPPVTLAHKYALRIIHPVTLATDHPPTLELLSKWLLRRYIGATPAAAAVVRVSALPLPVAAAGTELPALFAHGASTAAGAAPPVVTVLDVALEGDRDTTLGQRINRQLERAMRLGTDIIVLDASGGGEEVQLDWIVPAYPVVLAAGVVVLTPLQLAQTNGVSPAADTPDSVVQSLLSRIAVGLGAVLYRCAAGVTLPATIVPDASFHCSGLSSLRASEGVLADSRAHRVVPSMSRFVPPLRHGWLSLDTAALLGVAVETLPPGAVILELGSWYGKSARFMLTLAPPGVTLYAADYFKNNAEYSNKMWKLGPLDKMYLRHLRFDTFHANVAPFVRGGGDGGGCSGGGGSGKGTTGSDTGTSGSADVIMLKMDVYEAIEVVATNRVAPALVFIDCEKRAGPLRDMLQRVRHCFPAATIVGDDYAFESVRKAVAAAGLPFTVTLGEAYIVFPNKASHSAGAAAVRRWVDRLAPPAHDRGVAALVTTGRWQEALAACAAGYADPAHIARAALDQQVVGCQRELLHHEICRATRDKPDVLGPLWGRLFGSCREWRPPLLNHANLTPFDYLAHHIKWG